MGLLIWLVETVVLLGLFNFVVMPSIHALTGNSWLKLPVSVAAAVLSAVLMAWLGYVPYLLFVIWVTCNYHTLKVMEEPKFEAEAVMRINRRLFWVSSYSYIVLSCLLGLALQAEIGTYTAKGYEFVPVWEYALDWITSRI